jgi:hypothetical protein
MAGRLVRANSIIDLENKSQVEAVSGTPAAITERVSLQASPMSDFHLTDLRSR